MNHPHILLISLETIRRDHFRFAGYPKDLAPHMERLARGGVTCMDAVANSGWTLPQNITLHTGLYPLTHDLTLLREQHPLFANHVTLAEHLKTHGYRTFALVSNRNPYSAQAHYGFDRGFDEHVPGAAYNQHMDWTEEAVLARFRDHASAAPCFVYAHINDTHEPWDAPEPWRTMWGDSYHNRYEGEITYVDHYLGRIVAGLQQLGLFDETLIVIFGDHGTELWEHGFTEKKVNLYNEILHVPLIFHCPHLLPAGTRVRGLAESAQVAPTIVDLAGLPPLATAQGRSLVPRIRDGGAEGLAVVCSHTRHEHQREGGPVQFEQVAIQTLGRDRAYKFIRLVLHAEPQALYSDWAHRMRAIAVRCRLDPAVLQPGLALRELYDLRRDPGEGDNLLQEPAGAAPGGAAPGSAAPGGAAPGGPDAPATIAAALEAQLDAWIADTTRARPTPS